MNLRSIRAARAVALGAALLALATLSACASSGAGPTEPFGATDAWAKAADAGAMTAVFGVVANNTSDDLTIVSASSPLSTTVQLHETVAETDGTSMMQQKHGGFPVAAGTAITFEPGGDHIMLMKLTTAVEPGDDVPITLTFSDGSTFTFHAIAKDFAGANESYSSDSSDMGGMDMGVTPSPSMSDAMGK